LKRRDACLLLAASPAIAADFTSKWSAATEQTWLGPEYWANRLQDWRLRNDRIECSFAGGDRNVFLLTHELSNRAEPFEIRVKLGLLAGDTGYAGFRIGMKAPFNDYRDTAIYGIGLDAGITADGRLFIGNLAHSTTAPFKDVELVLRGDPSGNLTLTAGDASVTRTVPADWTTGGIALVCSSGTVAETPDVSQNVMTMSGINRRGRENTGSFRVWFRDWKITGPKIDAHPERAWGPILFALHTLSRNVLKLTAQMAPVSGRVRLQTRRGSSWRTVGESTIDPLSRTATFRIPRWDDTRDTPYRVAFGDQTYEGTVRRDPKNKQKIVVSALSCINDLGFPHTPIVRNLEHFKPDLLLFTGDQIYERAGSYGIERLPLERASLDYLRKWYLLGWSFRNLLRDTPAVCMPDDHDVYHGNVWGAGGRRAEGVGQPGQDSGGYVQPAEWVNIVQRTQTSHLPDPFDPTPVEQGIGVYYTDLVCGGVSFAILEDRKWKSAPKSTIPSAKIVNGWAQNPDYKAPKDGDVPGAQLLGPRQIAFLKHWATDWSGGVWMKAAVSQTIFANVATLPAPANTDAVTNKLPLLPPGEYPDGEVKVADHDSNGWPQTPRNDALRQIRRALAVHIAGDQHLASTIHYGVDDWDDAGFAICVPAVSNLFPRRWYPPEAGKNQKPGAPRNSGEYLDGFGNKITVHAVFNPSAIDVEPAIVNRRAVGYGIIEFDRATQNVTLTNWPRWVDASSIGALPCPGWPIVVRQADNGLPKSKWVLGSIRTPEKGALLQVAADEILYTYRMVEDSFTPPVPGSGKYTVTIRNAAGKVLSRHSIVAFLM
jgi:alkaline phosphatase D